MDEMRIVAWIDGELSPEEAAEVEAAVAADPGLAALADRHRRIRARVETTLTPLLASPSRRPRPRTATVISLAAARQERQAPPSDEPEERRRINWWWVAVVAVSLSIGLAVGQSLRPGGIADRAGALTLSPPIVEALERQASGDTGAVNVAVSFRDHDGRFCRSFVAQYIGGVACKAADGWQLRYAAPVDAERGDYRMAGGDPASAKVIATMIAGTPLDPTGERKAMAAGRR